MLTDFEKRFFRDTARGVRNLSGCPVGRGAVLVKANKMVSTGFNRTIVKDWEMSAIYDAVFSSRDMDLTGAILFCTYPPNIEDFKLMVAVGVDTLYILEDIKDRTTIDFLNSIAEAGLPLEIVKLQ